MEDILRYLTLIFLSIMFMKIIINIIDKFGVNFVGIFGVLGRKFKDLWHKIKNTRD